MIVAVRIRGISGVSRDKKLTFDLLRMFNKNYCVVVQNTKNYIGMLDKLKDYITWGEINEETFLLLIKERGRLARNKPITQEYLKEKNISLESFVKEIFNNKKSLKDIPGLKQFFRLKPPLNGFERGGIKKPYSLGGALGYRKDKINDIIRRMI